METSNAILVELEKFLCDLDPEEPPTLKVYQKLNPEALELLLELQEYAKLIFFYDIEPEAASAFETQLKEQGLIFERLLSAKTPTSYQNLKSSMPKLLKLKYSISCYIDETDSTSWKSQMKLSRLKF